MLLTAFLLLNAGNELLNLPLLKNKGDKILQVVVPKVEGQNSCSCWPSCVVQYAAVMFHSDPHAFEATLGNLEPHLHASWAVRLFLPWNENHDIKEKSFSLQKEYILASAVVAKLTSRCILVTVSKHDMSDLGSQVAYDAISESGAGPLLANHFALSRETYEAIPEEHILIFQQDAAFCSRNKRTLDSFMHHLYLGAPWKDRKVLSDRLGVDLEVVYGNGGLSVRSKTFILECIDLPHYKKDYWDAREGKGLPEDLFFSRCLFEHHEDAVDINEAKKFAAEESIELPRYQFIAVHDPCRAFEREGAVGCSTEEKRNLTRMLIDSCPEARRVIARCVAECDFGKSSVSTEHEHLDVKPGFRAEI